ncbi:trigger factor [Allopseudospirillum japonicum]|uniref:Trigger factor n=1 Tax=Allopseudospirillum japonicum TaxID=64971 RepID=A0A1H6RX39_9GAMM|nr:trigger factor [Allopseudospirillum japonicum]SEI60301.1 trigger factor [Allopseudospirillum japonicum]
MQVSVETTSGLERRLTIQIPAELVDTAVDSRLKETARQVRIDGFRPGKVPMKVVKSRYGVSVRQEVASELMRNHFVEAVTQEKLNPAGTPSIEPKSVVEGQPLEFVAVFEVYPEVALNSLEGESIERPQAEVTDADVLELIEELRKQRMSWSTVERAAALEDQVNIDFEGFIDGEAFEGGKGERYDLVLGSNSFIPGFEDQLVGTQAGDEKDVEVTFPEQYQAEQLAGKAAVFKVKVNAVKARELPELNEEFFTIFGVQEGGETAFREEVRKNMERELQKAVKNRVKESVLDRLLAKNPIEVPKALVDGEVDVLRRQAVQQFNFGQEFDPAQLPAELFADQAKKRVQLGLLIAEVVASSELKADKETVRALVEEQAQAYQEPEKVVEYYYQDENLLRQVEAAALEEQVVETLLQQLEVTDKNMSYKEVMQPKEEADEAEDQQEVDA